MSSKLRFCKKVLIVSIRVKMDVIKDATGWERGFALFLVIMEFL